MSCKKIKAAVSIIIVKPNAPNDAQVLLIERSKNKNDPWSGHMAFPGGRYQDNDQDILSTAIRETLEEIGLDLRKESSFFESNKKNLIPRLSDVKTLKIHEKNIVVTPFLFGLKKKPEIVINKEVQQVVWIPLKFFLESKNRKCSNFKINGEVISLPCYFYNEKVIWGITLSMIDEIFENLDKLFI